MKPIPPTFAHLGPVSKRFRIPGSYIYYRLFEGNLIGFLDNEIRGIRIAHRSKVVSMGCNSQSNYNFTLHFLEAKWNKFEEKEEVQSGS
jgi:hypothetical protein